MTLGQRIAQRRKQLGLSQEALADAVGVSRQAVSKWELDEAQPDAAKIVLLAQALELTTDELLLGQTEKTAPTPGAPTAPPDHLSRLGKLIRKHGYKVGYLFIVWGLLLLLGAGAGFLMFRGFFAAADESYREFDSFSQTYFSGWTSQSGIQFEPANIVTLSPEEIDLIEQGLSDPLQVTLRPAAQTHAFPVSLQRAVYAVLALPAILGVALIVTGTVVLVKYKRKEE